MHASTIIRRAVRIALMASIVLALGSASVLALVYLRSAEPWPVALRHGPDTGYAKRVFARHVPGIPTAHVRDLYAWEKQDAPGARVVLMAYDLSPGRSLDPILRALQLRASDLQTAGRSHPLPYVDGPYWWPSRRTLRVYDTVYHAGATTLWFAPPAGHVVVQIADR